MSHRQHALPRLLSAALLSVTLVPVGAAGCAQGSDSPFDPASEGGDDPAHEPWSAPVAEEPELPPHLRTVTAEGRMERMELLKQRFIERVERHPYGPVTGHVAQLDESPMANVMVRIGGQETTTDAEGRYALARVPLGNHVITFEREGYVLTQRPVSVEPAMEPQVDAYLLPRSAPRRFDADRGAQIVEGPLTIDIEPQDLMFERGSDELHGEVEATITAIDPRQPGHLQASPARLEAVDAAGERVGLFSYGMVEVEIFQGGRRVQVRPGQTVTVTLSMGDDFEVKSDDVIPMWHHDTTRGLWVQDRNVNAMVQWDGDKRVAVTALPHFSSWNFDAVTNASCALVTVPGTTPVTNFRVLSTDSAGNADGLWNFESQCRADSKKGSACVTNVPTSGVSFKLQAMKPGTSTWCDLQVAFDGSEKTVFNGSEMQTWLSTYGDGSGEWCGAADPAPAANNFLSGTYILGNFPAKLERHVRLGIATMTPNCSSSGIGSSAAGDGGFATMASNAKSSTYKSNFDRDTVADGVDKCPGRNAGQADLNDNGIGDACEAWCHVPSSDPYWSWYDYDGDGVDDLCDNAWSTSNPSQYVAPSDGGGSSSSSGGGACFVEGTLITMADGTKRPIEQVAVGDEVLSYDVAAGQIASAPVTHTFIHPDSEGIVLVNGGIQATGNHPFYAGGQWVRADQLHVGDELLGIGGGATALSHLGVTSAAQITSLESTPLVTTVYNIEVAEHHNYFAGGVLVHNKIVPISSE